MSRPDGPWTATLSVVLPDSREAEWLASALGPESAREVPRARASVNRRDATTVEVLVHAADAGAMRAALNTYLGWIDLTLATARTARATAPETDRP
jgi:tRNA threonylcarbamoyladenosine modification (KEOPS) complex  Pcc1 subunit